MVVVCCYFVLFVAVVRIAACAFSTAVGTARLTIVRCTIRYDGCAGVIYGRYRVCERMMASSRRGFGPVRTRRIRGHSTPEGSLTPAVSAKPANSHFGTDAGLRLLVLAPQAKATPKTPSRRPTTCYSVPPVVPRRAPTRRVVDHKARAVARNHRRHEPLRRVSL